MSKDNTTFADIVKKILARKWQVIAITFGITVVGVAYVVSLPRMYTATTTIVAEKKGQSSGALGMLGGLGLSDGSSSGGVTLELAPVIIESTPFLLKFKDVQVAMLDNQSQTMPLGEYLSLHQKAPWWRFSSAKSNGSQEGATEASTTQYELSMSDVSFVQSAKNIFTILKGKKFDLYELSARTQDPLVSTILVDSLTSRIQKYLTLYQTQKASQELTQSIEVAKESQARYYEMQERYAAAVDRNQNLIRQEALSKLDRLKTDMNVAYQAYSASAQQVEAARTKLLENTPVFTVINPPYLETSPSYPNRKLFVMVSFVLGLFVGIGSVIMGDVRKLIFAKDQDDAHTPNN